MAFTAIMKINHAALLTERKPESDESVRMFIYISYSSKSKSLFLKLCKEKKIKERKLKNKLEGLAFPEDDIYLFSYSTVSNLKSSKTELFMTVSLIYL